MSAKSILLVGVGGQGTILTSKILTQGLLESGFDVKMSEIHGMSQRGGSVSTHVRYGDTVNAPTIGVGEADILVSFEEIETCRWLEYLKPGGRVILNRYRLPSAPMLTGQAAYPANVLEAVRRVSDPVAVDAMEIAAGIGMSKAMNMVLLGVLVRLAGLEKADWKRCIGENVKPRFVECNQAAYQLGVESVEQSQFA